MPSIGFPIVTRNKIAGMELKDRVKWAMAHGGYKTQAPLAKKVGCPQSVISNLLTGSAKTSRYLTDIALACKVSPQWLYTGKGERRIGELEELFYSLHASDQQAAMDMMRALKASRST